MANNQKLSATITIGGALSQTFKTAVGGVSREFTNIGRSIRDLTSRQKRLSDAANHWEKQGRDASKFRAELVRVNRELEKQRKLQTIARDQAANNAKRGELRGQLFDAVALGAVLVAPTRTAMNFEQSMAKVGAVSRASAEDLTRLTKTARDLGATTNWSASQAAEGMQFLAMAGFSTEQTISAMPGMLSLASAGAIDLGAAADIASNILTGFNLEAAEMGRLGDVLTNTFTTSNTSLSMLGESMKYVAPVAASTGVSLEQAAAMVGKLGDAGIQGSQAGTALRAVINRLAAPAGEAAKMLEQLGIKTTDANGNLRELPDILGELNNSMDGFGTAAKANITSTIFGMEAASAATVLMAQAGTGNLQKYAESLKEVGSAARVAQKQNETAQGAMLRLGSAVESISITIGNVLLPVLATGAEALASVIGVVDTLAQEFPLLTTVVVGGTAALIALKVAAIAGGYAFTFIKGAWLAATATAIKLGAVLPAVAGGIKAIGLALMANPIGLIIGGIALAAGLLIANWEPVKAFFLDTWESIKTGAAALWDGIKAIFNWSPLAALKQGWEVAFNWIKGKLDWVGGAISKVKSFFGFGSESGELAEIETSQAAANTISSAGVATAGSASAAPRVENSWAITIQTQPGQDARQIVDELERRQREREQSALFDRGLAYGY